MHWTKKYKPIENKLTGMCAVLINNVTYDL